MWVGRPLAWVGHIFKWVGQLPEWVGHGLPGLIARTDIVPATSPRYWLRFPERMQFKIAVFGVYSSSWYCTALLGSARPCVGVGVAGSALSLLCQH